LKYRVGTRGSKLALAQTEEVLNLLKKEIPGAEFEIVVMRTRGDVDLKTPLYMIESKGIFEREINSAVERGEIDFAVHSMKDLPTSIELAIAAVPPRRSPYDVIVTRDGSGIAELPRGARVGTSSMRRISHLKYLRPDLEVVPIRGNVDTRLRKLENLDAIVVAEAALERLNLNVKGERIEEMTPAAGQGALAVVSRKEIVPLLSRINDEISFNEVMLERKVMSGLRAGCKTPVGVHADLRRRIITISAVSRDFKRIARASVEIRNISSAADEAVEEFLSSGGMEILSEWRRS
jgi:hydroxymethylbilane synthase